MMPSNTKTFPRRENSNSSTSSFGGNHKSNSNLSSDDTLNFPGQWRFSQCFGDKSESAEIAEGIQLANYIIGDLISALQFDKSGIFLASGDRAGRIVLFEKSSSSNEYRFYTEFQSHEPEFDYLKSLEINEKINKIEWWASRPVNDSLFLLTTNGKKKFFTQLIFRQDDKNVED
jgi:hypothetical protein